ncbi:MAG: WG repeat-containing protein [Prolixibacteraceae bacterium]|nr:WG repeat-containing protein [Prolixibacteraceae bacterium]
MYQIKKYPVFIFLLFLSGLVAAQDKPNHKNGFLVRFCLDENDENCGYVNYKGDTIIHAGKYAMCLTDTIRGMGVVLQPDAGFIGINNTGNFLFEIFNYDNGPDYLSEGLFRIIKNGKIGYADTTGKIRIRPKYDCAYPFENGKAKVSLNCLKSAVGEFTKWESSKWFCINKKGKKIKN